MIIPQSGHSNTERIKVPFGFKVGKYQTSTGQHNFEQRGNETGRLGERLQSENRSGATCH